MKLTNPQLTTHELTAPQLANWATEVLEMPPSLEKLDMSSAGKFTGGIPTEWGSLTNLKELKMANCGLSGA